MADNCCFVGGLAWATDEATLRNTFSQYGQVVDVTVIYDRESGRSRGFGFVYFADRASVNAAISGMNGAQLDGRVITVSQAQSSPTGGRGRGVQRGEGSYSGRGRGRGGQPPGYDGSGGGGY